MLDEILQGSGVDMDQRGCYSNKRQDSMVVLPVRVLETVMLMWMGQEELRMLEKYDTR